MSDQPASYRIPLEISKRDDDRRLVFGFAKFSEDPDNRGYLLIDKQGDVITPDDLENSAYSYVLDSRDAGEMHITKGAASLVESVMITPEKLAAWGLPEDSVPIGWWTGYHVHEVEKGTPDPWDKIVKGEYTAFSVEGVAVREEIVPPEPDQAEEVQKALFSEEEIDGFLTDDPSFFESLQKRFLVWKHDTGRPHPDSSHGNRLYSDAAEGVGDMMKQLKTRFKRVENATLTKMANQFASRQDTKSSLAHDQIVAELVRRNLLSITKASFRTPRFKELKEELAAAVTEQQKQTTEEEED